MFKIRQPLRRPPSPTASSVPWVANLTIAGIQILVNLFQLFVLPLYFLPRSTRWSLMIIPMAALNNPFWALIHEAIHDLFSSSNRTNSGAGRLLSVFFGSPFHVLRLTHLSHHKFNRSPLEKGTEVYDPTRVSKCRASFNYFFYIFCGLYLLEVCSTFLFFLPAKSFYRMGRQLSDQGNAQERWLARKFMDAKLVREIRIDGIAILLIFGLSAFCYRAHWGVLVSLLAARMFLISFMDNVYHYGSRLNVTVSGHNLWLPRIFSRWILNFNFHRVHHRNPAIPWPMLPELFAAHSDRFDDGLFPAAWSQLRGPIPASDLVELRPVMTEIEIRSATR